MFLSHFSTFFTTWMLWCVNPGIFIRIFSYLSVPVVFDPPPGGNNASVLENSAVKNSAEFSCALEN